MAKEEDILTELIEDAIDQVYEQLENSETSAKISGYTVTAIANTAKQIRQDKADLVAALEQIVKRGRGDSKNLTSERCVMFDIAQAATMKEIVREVEGKMQCTCDLDNWEPEKSTGHSWVCQIHKAALKELEATDA